MSQVGSESQSDSDSYPQTPLSLVVHRDRNAEHTSEPPKKRKKSEETSAEEILVEIEPQIQEDECENEKTKVKNVSEKSESPPRVEHLFDSYDVDELTLSISRKKFDEIIVQCPFCCGPVSYDDIGSHLFTVHKLARFICPGRKCPSRIESPLVYKDHLLRHHFQPVCTLCNYTFDPRSYPEHLMQHLKYIKQTILKPRQASPPPDKPLVLIKPKPLEDLLGVHVSSNYEILLEGKLVIIDGLYFYIRNDVAFLDCFHCSKAVSLDLYGPHIVEFHRGRDTIECRAADCHKTVKIEALQDHILMNHTRIRCKSCFGTVELLQIRNHDMEACENIRRASKALELDLSQNGALMRANPHSTGVHFLSHFLDERIRQLQKSPVRLATGGEYSTREEENTSHSHCSSIDSNGNQSSLDQSSSAAKKKTKASRHPPFNTAIKITKLILTN